MTQDAINKANALSLQISTATSLRNKQLGFVKMYFGELSTDEQNRLISTLQAIHEPRIAALKNSLTQLTADYTDSSSTSSNP